MNGSIANIFAVCSALKPFPCRFIPRSPTAVTMLHEAVEASG
jgi:hypothetical protein